MLKIGAQVETYTIEMQGKGPEIQNFCKRRIEKNKTFLCCFGTVQGLTSALSFLLCLAFSINQVYTRLLCVCECERTSVYLPLQDLYAAGEGKFGTDEEKFITILGNRSAEHLRKGEFVWVCLCQNIWMLWCVSPLLKRETSRVGNNTPSPSIDVALNLNNSDSIEKASYHSNKY